MEKELQKYFAASEAKDRWQNEISDIAYPVFVRFSKIHYINNRSGLGYDRFPDDIDNIYVSGENLVITGSSSYRGCTDRERCSIPLRFLNGTAEERTAALDAYEVEETDKKRLAEQKTAKAVEESELAMLHRLQEKYAPEMK